MNPRLRTIQSSKSALSLCPESSGEQVAEIPVTRYFLIVQAYSPVARRFELRKKFPKSMHKFRDLNRGQSIVDRITGEYGSSSHLDFFPTREHSAGQFFP